MPDQADEDSSGEFIAVAPEKEQSGVMEQNKPNFGFTYMYWH